MRFCSTLAVGLGTLALAACGSEPPPTGPDLAKGGASATFAVTPGSLTFDIPPATPATITARVQFTGLITAATSDAGCATVSPLSVPAGKPPGSSLYLATFTVTPVAIGHCTITLTDKRGDHERVEVRVQHEGLLVFTSTRDVGSGEIYLMKPDGSHVTRVTHNDTVEGQSPGG